MAFNTNNPIGSSDARDLYDNAVNLDNATNGTPVGWTDRLGAVRKTWAGMESDFQAFLVASGYQDLGDYAPGIVITSRNQMFAYDGEFYRLGASGVLPYTTTGSWSEDGPFFVSIGDAVLRQDLANDPDIVIGYYHGLINVLHFGTLEAARVSSDAVGMTIVVSTILTAAQSNITAPWPADRALRVELAGGIANTTEFVINGPLITEGDAFVGSGTWAHNGVMREVYRNGPAVPGVTQDLPLAKASVVYNSYDNPPINNDRDFNFISQMWSGVAPTASPINNKSNIALAGAFYSHRAGNSGTFINALNPMISWGARPRGTVNVSGTAVTRTSGTNFLTGTGWENAIIFINGTIAEIASVQDSDHLTLKATAGTQTGVAFIVGGAIGVEIDVNSADDDAQNGTALVIASGGRDAAGTGGEAHHVDTGIAITGAFGDASAFRKNIVMGSFMEHGIITAGPSALFPNASAFDMSNGATGSSVIRGGINALVLTDAPSNLLRITPSTDTEAAVIYGTNAAGNSINWYISKNGLVAVDSISGIVSGAPPKIINVEDHADNAAAIASGLTAGMVYRTGDVMKIVH